MRFTEFMGNILGKSVVKKLKNISAISFQPGRTDKTESRTPHYEIDRSLDMLLTNPMIASSIQQLVSFIIPNRNINIISNDPKTVAFLEGWHKLRPQIIEEYKNFLTSNLTCGNGILEYVRTANDVNKNSEILLDNIYSYNNVATFYIDANDSENYIIQVDTSVNSFYFRGEYYSPEFIQIYYVQNGVYFYRSIYGIRVKRNKFFHWKSGWNIISFYGRSVLASAIDANNVMMEIINSWDTISKTRQIDKKLIVPDGVEASFDLNDPLMEQLQEDLEDADKSFSILNIPLKLIQNDISVSGKYDLMEGVFDILRRMVMMSLLPQHLTPWGDSVTTQGAEQSMPSFLGRVKAKQNELSSILSQAVVGELRKTYEWLDEDAIIAFDEPKIMPDTYYINLLTSLSDRFIIDNTDVKKYLLKIGILDSEILKVDEETLKDEDTEDEDKDRIPDSQDTKFDFKVSEKRLKESIDNKKKLKILKSEDVGGHVITLVFNKDSNSYLIFDGIELEASIKMGPGVTQKDALVLFNRVKKKVKDSFNDFLKGKTEEDKIIKDLEKEVGKDLSNKIDKLIKQIDASKVKKENFKEDFLSDRIIPKVDDLFKDFTPNLRNLLKKTLQKMGLEVIKSDEDGGKIDKKKDKDLLMKKRSLILASLTDQIKKTSDGVLNDIKQDLFNGIKAGKDVKKIKQEIEAKYDFKGGVEWKFDRLINHQIRSNTNLLKLKKMQLQGFTEFLWQTREDEKVRKEHAKKNNKVFNIEKALNSNDPNAYPGKAVNCRCNAIPYR